MENIWITKAEYVQDYQIKLFFSEGTSGIIDLQNELKKPIFKPLQDINYFKTFKLGSWTIEWDNGADFAPEFLYNKVKLYA